MKIVLKETIERYHVVDLNDYDSNAFADAVSHINPRLGIDAIKELIDELQRLYGIEGMIQEGGAGQETTLIEVVDEYDE